VQNKLALALACLLIPGASLSVGTSPSLAQEIQGAQAPQGGPQAPQRILQTGNLTDLRVSVVKLALQLTPEQEKYWPAVEVAIRSRADARRARLEDVTSRVGSGRDFVQVMQERSNALSERATELKKLSDAWQPLYANLSDVQKQRMRVLAVLVFTDVGEALERRRMREEDEEGWGSGAVGPGGGERGFGRE